MKWRYKKIPIVKENYSDRLKSNLAIWMIDKKDFMSDLASAIMLSKLTCKKKMLKGSFTIEDLTYLASAYGYTLALVNNKTGEAYDLGRYLKGE